jgi:glutamate-1-semialdehyde 2,1-aminomutase
MSASIGARAERVMPAGDTRAAGYHLPYPLTLARGEGAQVWDVDGNRYWDLSGNFTSLVHGHAYPPIVEAAHRSVADGTAWPARNPAQIELAELLVERVASVDQVRFCNSGSEANMLAAQVARIATGRSRILMARFGYHGAHEAFEVGTFDGLFHVPGAEATHVATYGDADGFETILAEHGDDIAAVFLEPVMGAGGIISAPHEFHSRVADATRNAGAVFVLDEVITLRLATGGRQSELGITPDLTTFGKIIGGGFPVGAIGGRGDLMSILDPRQFRMFHSGTFNGNPVSMAAGTASVRELTPERIDTMARLTRRLLDAIGVAASARGIPFSSRVVGSLANIYLLDTPPDANPLRADTDTMARLHLAGMNHGLYFASRGMLVTSSVMDDAAIDDIIDRFDQALDDLATTGLPSPSQMV